MATTNPVSQVLVALGNQAILAAGNRQDALLNGQLGFFNYHTGLSVDGTVFGDTRDIFIAVGINRTSGGTAAAEDVNKSSGQVIQIRNLSAITVKGYVAEIQKVVEVTGFTAKCSTDYGLKIEFRNQRVYQTSGYSQFSKTFTYRTADCDQCLDCGPADAADVALGLALDINADTDALVIATLVANSLTATIGAGAGATASITIGVGTEQFVVPVVSGDTATQVATKIAAFINGVTTSNYKATSAAAVLTARPKIGVSAPTALITLVSANGTGVTVTGAAVANVAVTADAASVATFKAAYPGAGLVVRITGVAEVRPGLNGNINLHYHKAGMNFIVSTPFGFDGNGVVTETVQPQFKEGSGYDLQQQEYLDGGWNGKPGPYRQSTITGLGRDGFEYLVNPASNYNQVVLKYDQYSVGGWLEYMNNLETVIAIPCADTVTLIGFIAVLDLIATQFQPNANDVASMACSNNPITLLTPATDGIESLS